MLLLYKGVRISEVSIKRISTVDCDYIGTRPAIAFVLYTCTVLLD